MTLRTTPFALPLTFTSCFSLYLANKQPADHKLVFGIISQWHADQYQHFTILADLCQHFAILADLCQHFAILADLCQHFAILADLCQHFAILVDLCQHFAILWHQFSDLKFIVSLVHDTCINKLVSFTPCILCVFFSRVLYPAVGSCGRRN